MSNNPYKPKLVFIGEPFAGKVYELTLDRTTVGRGDDNTLVIRHPSISLAHCEILVHGPEVLVNDLGSANGTVVHGTPLQHQQAQLKSGQLVQFGSVEARLDLTPLVDDDSATNLTAIHEHGRLVRDHRREQNNPKPLDPSMTLDDGSGSGEAEHTVILTKVPQSREITNPPAPVTSANLPGKSSRKMAMAIVLALAAGLVVLLWLWWGRK